MVRIRFPPAERHANHRFLGVWCGGRATHPAYTAHYAIVSAEGVWGLVVLRSVLFRSPRFIAS